MQKAFRNLFAAPVFPEDEDKTRSAAILNFIGWSIIFVLTIILMVRSLQGEDVNLVEVNLILIALITATGVMLFLSHNGQVQAASLLLVTTSWLGLSYVAWVADGIRDVTFVGLSIPILLAGLLLGWQGAAIVTTLSIISGWVLAYAETADFFSP